MGGKDTESPDGETGYISAVTDVQKCACCNSKCIGYDRYYVHMVLDKPCTSGCSVHVLAVSCKFIQMSRQPGHKRNSVEIMAAKRNVLPTQQMLYGNKWFSASCQRVGKERTPRSRRPRP